MITPRTCFWVRQPLQRSSLAIRPSLGSVSVQSPMDSIKAFSSFLASSRIFRSRWFGRLSKPYLHSHSAVDADSDSALGCLTHAPRPRSCTKFADVSMHSATVYPGMTTIAPICYLRRAGSETDCPRLSSPCRKPTHKTLLR